MLKKLARLFAPDTKLLPDDPFIRRLRCSVIGEGMLHPGNVYLIDLAIREMPEEGAVIEIGSYGGLSGNLICYLLRKYRRHNIFFGCDAWLYEGYEDAAIPAGITIDGRTDISREAYMQYIKDSFVRSTRFLSSENLPYACHLRSDAFFEKWKNGEKTEDVFGRCVRTGGKIAFAYVDGDHSYAAAKKDTENVLYDLVPGGYLLLDDSADTYSFGSARLAKELRKDPRLELVLANPNYLFRRK